MHGMVNRALQGFLTATYGDEVWGRGPQPSRAVLR